MATKPRKADIGENASTVDAEEVRRFDRMAADWWNPAGVMRPLHAMNPVRLGFIRDQAIAHFGLDAGAIAPLRGLRGVDVGCGGGLLSEPLTRMGAAVTGLDPAAENIAVARQHAADSGLDIDYRASTIEQVAADGERFDIVLALEVVEHVADVPAFIDAISRAAKPGGLVVLSTLNRSLRSFGAAILGAEYLLRWLPVGTHDWAKFLRPEELQDHLVKAGLEPIETRGMVPDLLRGSFAGGWSLSPDTAVNYIISAAKPA